MIGGNLALSDGKLSAAPKKQSAELPMKFEPPKAVDLTSADPKKLIMDANTTPNVSVIGSKSVNCLRLKELEKGFKVPEFIALPNTLPQTYVQKAKNSNLAKLCKDLDKVPSDDLANIERLGEAIQDEMFQIFTKADLAALSDLMTASLPKDCLLAIRSSSTLEDLPGLSGAGLYDSILNIPSNEPDLISNAIISVWLSLFGTRAIVSRARYQIPTESAQMAVLVQKMVIAEVAFIMHTKGVEGEDAVMIEVCEGQGEVLASANEKGTPYRLTYDKSTGTCQVTAWGSYSHGLFRGETELVRKRVKGLDDKFLMELGTTLGKIGVEIETAYGSAQDIEGCVEAGG